MGKEISQRAFARTAGVSPAAVRHALSGGRLLETDTGLDPEEGTNTLFLEVHQEKAVEAMEETGRLLPGWAAVYVKFPRRNPYAICFLPPYGMTSFPSSNEFLEGWLFDAEKWSATDPQGKAHQLVIVTCEKAHPPWLEKAAREGKPAHRPSARGRVASRGGKAHAESTMAHHARRRA